MKTILSILVLTSFCFKVIASEKINPLAAPPLIMPQWNEVGAGLFGDVATAISHGGDIYVSGCFENAGGIAAADYIARWDGCDWHAVVPGIDGCVADIVFVGNDLYLAGNFTGHVAKWNGSVWDVLEGINNEAMAIAANANGVYVGGLFTNAGNIAAADGIARWTGSAWAAMGTGIAGITEYMDITTNGNDVYVGGDFLDAGGVANADRIAKWDGTSWQSLGQGLNNTVAVVRTQGSNVYAAGYFNNAGGNPDADALAVWNGNAWGQVGSQDFEWYYGLALNITSEYLYVTVVYDCYYVQLHQYDFQNSEWFVLGDLYTDAGCVVRSAVVPDGDDVYCGLFGFYYSGLYRYGEPGPFIPITGVPSSICEDHSPIPLPTTQGGYTGNWSGDGVTNNTFNPSGLLFQNVYLLFTPNPGQCVTPAYTEIYVYLDYVPTTDPPGLCENSAPIPLWPYQAGATGNWSGPGVINNVLHPAGLNGTVVLLFTPAPGQCYQETYEFVFVNELYTPVITGVPATMCEEDAPLPLLLNLNGITGNWSGIGVANNIFYPQGLNGIYTLTFTPDPGQCATNASISLLVEPHINITITGVPGSICQLAQPIPLPTLQSGVNGNWTGPGVGSNMFTPTGLSGNIQLSFIPASGECADITNTFITVFLDNVIISGVPENFCESDPPINLPNFLNGIQGNWSGPGVQNNVFNPNGLNGSLFITFNPIPSECANEGHHNILVEALTIPFITGVPSTLCDLSGAIALPVVLSDIEGNWSGNGVTNNSFDPEGLGGNVVLSFIPFAGQCAGTSNTTILVQTAEEPLIENVPLGICSLAAPVILPTLQSGVNGNWSGTGVSNNVFNPSGLEGNYPLSFTPNAGECALTAYHVITVFDSFVPEISGVPQVVCVFASSINLPVIQEGVSGNWSGQGVANNVFNPAGLLGEIELAFTPTGGQCAEVTTTTINVVTSFVPQITDVPAHVCEIATPIVLPSLQNNVTGNWSGNGVSNNIFSPAGILDSTLLTFNPDPNQCAVSATWNIAIDTAINTTISDLPDALCHSDDAFPLNTIQSGIHGLWTGNGVANDTLSLADLQGIIQLTFTPLADQCALSAIGTIQVDTSIHPLLSGIPDSVCQTDDAMELPIIQGGIAGNWEGPGVIQNIFYPDSLQGSHMFMFLYQNGACEDTSTANIFVHESPYAVDLQIHCDTSANTYSVTFIIDGGDSTGYYVDGTIITGNVFSSSAFPYSQPTFSFLIEDNRGCGPVRVDGTNTCVCATYSGTMPANAILVCRGNRFQVTHNGDAQPDPDDALTFVLHDENGNILGNIFSINAVGNFSFQPGMLLNHPYYISVVAGNQTGNGEVDFTDPCLSVSAGLPVIFYQCTPDDQNTSHTGINEFPFIDQEVTNRNTYSNELSNLQIISISLFDMLGRRLWLKENPGISINEVKSYILRENQYPGGTYFYSIEAMNGGGQKFQMQHRITCVSE